MRLELTSINDQLVTLRNRLPDGEGRAVTKSWRPGRPGNSVMAQASSVNFKFIREKKDLSNGSPCAQPGDVHKFRLRETPKRTSSISSFGPAAHDMESSVATVRQGPASKAVQPVHTQGNSAAPADLNCKHGTSRGAATRNEEPLRMDEELHSLPVNSNLAAVQFLPRPQCVMSVHS